MLGKYVYLTLVKGGQKKEDQSQQTPTFRCSAWSILRICILKKLLLSPHRGDVASTCPGHCLIRDFYWRQWCIPDTSPLNGKGMHSGVEGDGTSMSDTGGLIVYEIIGWKIRTLEIKGGARAPPGSARDLNLYSTIHTFTTKLGLDKML